MGKCLQCFDAVGWAAGRAGNADLHIIQLMPLPFLPFRYQLTWVVPDKGLLKGCVCVCVIAAKISKSQAYEKAPKVSTLISVYVSSSINDRSKEGQKQARSVQPF